MTTTSAYHSLGSMTREIRHRWFLFVILGAVLLAGACFAASDLWVASLASVGIIATFMLIAGLVQIFHGFTAHGWTGPILPFLAGLLYFSAGVAALVDPAGASTVISFSLGIFLCLSGLARIIYGMRLGHIKASGWITASGFGTLLVGALIVLTWPISGLWLPGMVLTGDLAFQGCCYISFGIHIRRDRGFRRRRF